MLEVIREKRDLTRLDCKYVFHFNGKQIKDFRVSWSSACRELSLGFGYSLTKKYVDKWKRSGLNPGPYMHDFRRTAARNLVRSGVSEKVAMKITGHRSRSVFERYNISTDEDLQFAAELQAQNHRGVKNGVNLRNSLNRAA